MVAYLKDELQLAVDEVVLLDVRQHVVVRQETLIVARAMAFGVRLGVASAQSMADAPQDGGHAGVKLREELAGCDHDV